MTGKPTVEEYMTACLRQAYAEYPDCGFLLYVVDDNEFGALLSLSNMQPDEVEEVIDLVQDTGEVPFVPCDTQEFLN